VGEVFGPLFTLNLSNSTAAGGSADAEKGGKLPQDGAK
jgi:hypothetical protein